MSILNKRRKKWQPWNRDPWELVRCDDLVVLHDGERLRVLDSEWYLNGKTNKTFIVGDKLRTIDAAGLPRLLTPWDIGGIFLPLKGGDPHLEESKRAYFLRQHADRLAYAERFLHKTWRLEVWMGSKLTPIRRTLERIDVIPEHEYKGATRVPHAWKVKITLSFGTDDDGKEITKDFTRNLDFPPQRWDKMGPVVTRAYEGGTPTTAKPVVPPPIDQNLCQQLVREHPMSATFQTLLKRARAEELRVALLGLGKRKHAADRRALIEAQLKVLTMKEAA